MHYHYPSSYSITSFKALLLLEHYVIPAIVLDVLLLVPPNNPQSFKLPCFSLISVSCLTVSESSLVFPPVIVGVGITPGGGLWEPQILIVTRSQVIESRHKKGEPVGLSCY